MKGKTNRCFPIVLLFLMLLLMPIQVFAWSYGRPGVADDLFYEKFGPRADKLLTNLFAGDTAESGALSIGQIDVTDFALNDADYIAYSTPLHH